MIIKNPQTNDTTGALLVPGGWMVEPREPPPSRKYATEYNVFDIIYYRLVIVFSPRLVRTPVYEQCVCVYTHVGVLTYRCLPSVCSPWSCASPPPPKRRNRRRRLSPTPTGTNVVWSLRWSRPPTWQLRTSPRPRTQRSLPRTPRSLPRTPRSVPRTSPPGTPRSRRRTLPRTFPRTPRTRTWPRPWPRRTRTTREHGRRLWSVSTQSWRRGTVVTLYFNNNNNNTYPRTASAEVARPRRKRLKG